MDSKTATARLAPGRAFRLAACVPDKGEGMGRVAYADARQHRDILQWLFRALNSGQKRIWMATPYFLPTWKIRRWLRKAARTRCRCAVAADRPAHRSPSVRYAGHRYSAPAQGRVQSSNTQPCFLHLKMVLVDEWVSIGSCNFDHWNLRFQSGGEPGSAGPRR